MFLDQGSVNIGQNGSRCNRSAPMDQSRDGGRRTLSRCDVDEKLPAFRDLVGGTKRRYRVDRARDTKKNRWRGAFKTALAPGDAHCRDLAAGRHIEKFPAVR